MNRKMIHGIITFAISFVLALVSILGYNMVVHRQSVFAESAFWGNVTYMRITYALGANVNTPGCPYQSCYPPIVAAVYSGNIDAVRFLVERGADVNAKIHGTTALMAASAKGNVDIVKLLIASGADVNVDRDEEAADPDDTALKIAKLRGNDQIVELLKQAGAVETP